MLHPASAQRLGALLLVVDDDPSTARPTRAQPIYLAFFLLAAIHAHSVSGSLATSATVTPRKDGSNQEVHGMQHKNRFGAMAGAIALSFAGSSAAQDAVEWRVVEGGNGHWYGAVVFPTAITWLEARLDAESRGGGLACLTSPSENTWVHAQVASNPTAWNRTASWEYGPWIGGYRSTGADASWKWVSGEPWNFTSWHPSQPDAANQTTVSFGGAGVTGATWADTEPDEPVIAYIIEWSADCNNDGIVDFGQIRAGQLPDSNSNGIPDGCETDNGGSSPAIQWHAKSGGNGHWYQAVVASQGLGWSAARALAAALGGDLACADADGEKNFYFSSFGPAEVPAAWIRQAPWTEPNFGPWIGGMQDPGSAEPLGGWRWISGPSFNPAELGCCDDSGCAGPEDRLHLILAEGAVSWNDLPDTWSCGTMPRSLLIEWSTDCNGDGIVDFGQIRAGELADADHNNIPDCCDASTAGCRGDIVRDGRVDGVDLAAVLNNWGAAGGPIHADTNCDGLVDAEDLAIVLGSWGNCP